MQSIFEELYLGNIRFDSRRYGPNSPFVKAVQKKVDNMEKLAQTLNGYQKELFDNFCEAQGDIDDIARYNTFTAALKFGTLFMIELFTDRGEEL